MQKDNGKPNVKKAEHGKSRQDGNTQTVRRSERKHTQRFPINQDDIGECDDRNDKDYK